jgi:hypothetical protein
MTRHCEFCGHERNTYTTHDTLYSDAHGKIGLYVHYWCRTCGNPCDSEYATYHWYVVQHDYPYLSQTEHGPYPSEYAAKVAAKDIPGLEVIVVGRIGQRSKEWK